MRVFPIAAQQRGQPRPDPTFRRGVNGLRFHASLPPAQVNRRPFRVSRSREG
jgi:hypothetical protein